MFPSKTVQSLFISYLQEIETGIQASLSTLGPQTRLRDACSYALLSGGKRFRPILVCMMARALGNKANVMDAAIAVEYFHTASLIADDLPCMDDDDLRRDQPTLHKAFDEATALLASYALIAAGYEAIARCALQSPFNDQNLCALAIENASYNTGLLGATGGQFLDINPPNLTLESVKDIIHKKTVSLFEISFVLGWLFGGGNPKNLDLVKKAASHFGFAFQIADDIQDREQDLQNGRQINTATIFGLNQAVKMLNKELFDFFLVMKELGIDDSEFRLLGEQLSPPKENV